MNTQHVQVPKMNLKEEGLRFNDPYVYACIKRYMNNTTKTAFPSMAKLKTDSGLSEPTILASIKRLQDKGYIKVLKSDGRSNKYVFDDIKKFEIFSYDFLDNPKLTQKEKAYLVNTQQYMFKEPVAEKGIVEYDTNTICDLIAIDKRTLNKYEKSLQEKDVLTLIPVALRDPETGLNHYQRVYSFPEFANVLALKVNELSDDVEDIKSRLSNLERAYEHVLKENKALKKELFPEQAKIIL